jgi:hypothetical protein
VLSMSEQLRLDILSQARRARLQRTYEGPSEASHGGSGGLASQESPISILDIVCKSSVPGGSGGCVIAQRATANRHIHPIILCN